MTILKNLTQKLARNIVDTDIADVLRCSSDKLSVTDGHLELSLEKTKDKYFLCCGEYRQDPMFTKEIAPSVDGLFNWAEDNVGFKYTTLQITLEVSVKHKITEDFDETYEDHLEAEIISTADGLSVEGTDITDCREL